MGQLDRRLMRGRFIVCAVGLVSVVVGVVLAACVASNWWLLALGGFVALVFAGPSALFEGHDTRGESGPVGPLG